MTEHPVVYVDLIEDTPQTRAEWLMTGNVSLSEMSSLPAGLSQDEVVDALYKQYVERFQPYRWHSTSGGNFTILGHGERYFNDADAEHNIRLNFGADTIVYLRRAERGNELLRMPPASSLFANHADTATTSDCPAVLNLLGEHYPCDWPADADGAHPGWAHANSAAQAIWTEDNTMPNEQQGTRR